jgi:translation initiation factor 5A
MGDDGDTKDDVKMPEGEVGEKIVRLFKTEEKDTSKLSRPSSRLDRVCFNNVMPDVVILTAMGEEAAIEAKEAPRQG